MPPELEPRTKPILFGRSSSHFTRVTRIFAAEVGVDYSFEIVRDLMSGDPDQYGGNPSLKLPNLRTSQGVWFGALNICRELARRATLERRIVWPEQLDQPLLANAQELVVQAMATEVALIMAKVSGDGSAHQEKSVKSLTGAMAWLESNVREVIAALPRDRDLSFLEVTLYCLVRHLEFRKVLPTSPYPALNEFCDGFEARPSARETAYEFDR
jgi:glutathione S-transferase